MHYLLRNSVIFIWIQYFLFYEIMVYYLRFFKELKQPYSVKLEAYIGLILAIVLFALFLYKAITEKKILVRLVYFLAITYTAMASIGMLYFIINEKYSFLLESVGITIYVILASLTFFSDKQIYKEVKLYSSILVLFGIVFISWVIIIFVNSVIF